MILINHSWYVINFAISHQLFMILRDISLIIHDISLIIHDIPLIIHDYSWYLINHSWCYVMSHWLFVIRVYTYAWTVDISHQSWWLGIDIRPIEPKSITDYYSKGAKGPHNGWKCNFELLFFKISIFETESTEHNIKIWIFLMSCSNIWSYIPPSGIFT